MKSNNPTGKHYPPMPDEIDNEPSFVVEEIVDSRWYGPKGAQFPQWFVLYMVVWAGFGPEENSWEPYEVREGTGEKALQDYYSSTLGIPGTIG